MKSRRIGVALSLVAMCLLSLGSAVADDKIKGKGVVTGHSGSNVTVETDDGTITLVLSADTKIYHSVGLGARRKEDDASVLIPGLKLKYWGNGDPNNVATTQIYFDKDDLTLAKVIQAALNPTAQQVSQNAESIQRGKAVIQAQQTQIAASQQEIAANKQRIADNQQNLNEVATATQKRFSELGQYSVKDSTTVYFGSGEYALSDDYKQALAALAKEALENGDKAYLIQVSAFADASGAAAANQVLSKERAQAVTAYLLQECGIPVGRIVAPGAMGESNPVASNESTQGRAQNRRADVKLLINKGIAGSGGN
jgi:OmpA-OmpF porin, OOP family